jgi:hypothetical protein
MNLAQAGLGLAIIAFGALMIVRRQAFGASADAEQRRARRAQSLLNQERIDREDALYSSDAGRRVASGQAALFGVVTVLVGTVLLIRGLGA